MQVVHIFLREHSYKRLKLAQILGQRGVLFSDLEEIAGTPGAAAQRAAGGDPGVIHRGRAPQQRGQRGGRRRRRRRGPRGGGGEVLGDASEPAGRHIYIASS